MRNLEVEKLTDESFKEFGTIFNPKDCGEPLGENRGSVMFYPDRIVGKHENSHLLGLSVLELERREYKLEVTEVHDSTDEIIGNFNKNVIFHAAKGKNNKPDMENIHIFLLPAGWFVKINAGIWHHAPFVVGDEPTSGIVILPEKTYMNDCIVENIEGLCEINF